MDQAVGSGARGPDLDPVDRICLSSCQLAVGAVAAGGDSWLGLVQVLWGGALFFATSPLTALTAVVVGATTSFGRLARGVRAVALATTQGGAHGCGQHVRCDVCRDASFGACHPDPVASGQGAAPEIVGHTSCGGDGGNIGRCLGRRRWSFVASACGCVKLRWWWLDAPASA
jgi:hypothetical protein